MLAQRGALRIRIPYGTECVSGSLDVSGGESVVVAGADSTTINNFQPSWLVPAAICIYDGAWIHPLHVSKKFEKCIIILPATFYIFPNIDTQMPSDETKPSKLKEHLISVTTCGV